MNIDLKTLYSVIAPLTLCAVLKIAPAETIIRNGAFVQHHQLHQSNAPLKDYTLPANDDMHMRYHYVAAGHPHPYHHQHHQYHHHHYPQLPQQPYQQHYQHSQQHEDALLRESAKDPKNLRNGIIQNGAVTYDLGLPRYDILNAHEPPEIITSDQPHYQTNLKQLQQTQNFTLEDFGATTALPPTTTTEETTTTTTEEPEPKPTTITSQPEDITQSPRISEHLQRDVEKELSNVKNKLKKLNEELQRKGDLHHTRAKDRDVSFVVVRKNEHLRKKMKPAPFKAATLQPASDEKGQEGQESTIEPEKSLPINVQQQGNEPVGQSTQLSPLGTPTVQDLYMPIPSAAGGPTLSVYPYSENSNFYAIPASAPSLPTQYSDFNPYQAMQNPLNNFYSAPQDQLPMSVGNIHRLYRSASFLESSKKTSTLRR